MWRCQNCGKVTSSKKDVTVKFATSRDQYGGVETRMFAICKKPPCIDQPVQIWYNPLTELQILDTPTWEERK